MFTQGVIDEIGSRNLWVTNITAATVGGHPRIFIGCVNDTPGCDIMTKDDCEYSPLAEKSMVMYSPLAERSMVMYIIKHNQ